MINPIKNATTEEHAQSIAKAIHDADQAAYSLAMKAADDTMTKMVRWELLAFKDRVHYIVKHEIPNNKA